MKTLKLLFAAIILILVNNLTAQVSINTDGAAPDPTSMLDIKSSDKGLLIPRMTTAEIEAIYLPADGLQVYNTDEGKLYIFVENDFEWKEVSYATGNIQPNATYTIGTGGSCDNTVVHGVYYVGLALTPFQFVTIEVDVSTLGQYTITTNTTNGYNFIGNGVFATTGTQNINFYGIGTPVAEQTDNFTATANNNGGTCTFNVDAIISPTFLCGLQLVDSRDGQSYNTVQIGTQCWMAENLNIGTMINGSTDQTDNSTIEKYCYNNNAANCNTYGGLYQWDEAMQYVATEGAQGICPMGWHVPTDDQWMILEMELGMSYSEAHSDGLRGTNEGSKMAGNAALWNVNFLVNDPDFGASGLMVLPGGSRFPSYSFNYLGSHAFYWTSSIYNSAVRNRSLNSAYTEVSRSYWDKIYGFSIRCLQD